MKTTHLNFLVDVEMDRHSTDNDTQESTQLMRSRSSSSHSKQPNKRRVDEGMVGTDYSCYKHQEE